MAKRTKRTVPLDLMDEWKRRFMRGDIARISAEIGVTPAVVSIAFKQGQAEPYVTLGISKYFAKRDTPEAIIQEAQNLLK